MADCVSGQLSLFLEIPMDYCSVYILVEMHYFSIYRCWRIVWNYCGKNV